MTPEERRAQRISLVMGMRGHNSTLTREKVSTILEEVEGLPA
jgi:poly-beta-hydroxyalkanoate depolymerase